MNEKDAEIARLRDELARERVEHGKTRDALAIAVGLLADAHSRPVQIAMPCPLPHAQPPQFVPQIAPWFICADCRRSTSGRCSLHAVTYTPIVPQYDPFNPFGPGALPFPHYFTAAH